MTTKDNMDFSSVARETRKSLNSIFKVLKENTVNLESYNQPNYHSKIKTSKDKRDHNTQKSSLKEVLKESERTAKIKRSTDRRSRIPKVNYKCINWC